MIILKLIILITSVTSPYSGKNIGIILGATNAPKNAITIEINNETFFNFLFSSPKASYGIVYLKIITVKINPTLTTCSAREKFPKTANPKIGTVKNLFRLEFDFVNTSIT